MVAPQGVNLTTIVDDGENQMDADQLKDNFRHQAKQAAPTGARYSGDTDVLDMLGLSGIAAVTSGPQTTPVPSLKIASSAQSVASSHGRMMDEDLHAE